MTQRRPTQMTADRLLKIQYPQRKHFLALRPEQGDPYSEMELSALKDEALQEGLTSDLAELDGLDMPERIQAEVLRWCVRGLYFHLAIEKTRADADAYGDIETTQYFEGLDANGVFFGEKKTWAEAQSTDIRPI